MKELEIEKVLAIVRDKGKYLEVSMKSVWKSLERGDKIRLQGGKSLKKVNEKYYLYNLGE